LAEGKFVSTFQKKEIPEDILEFNASKNEKLVDVLLRANLITSKSEFRRLAMQEGIHSLDKKISITNPDILVESGVYRIGKRRFIKIVK